MEEKVDQSPEISRSFFGSDPSTDLKAREESAPLTQDFGTPEGSTMEEKPSQSAQPVSSEALLNPAASLSFSEPDLGTVERVNPEEEKQREVDLNVLFPGREYDLNRLFPDQGTKKLLLELRRNKRDIQRFIKNLDFEEE